MMPVFDQWKLYILHLYFVSLAGPKTTTDYLVWQDLESLLAKAGRLPLTKSFEFYVICKPQGGSSFINVSRDIISFRILKDLCNIEVTLDHE